MKLKSEQEVLEFNKVISYKEKELEITFKQISLLKTMKENQFQNH